MSFSFIHTGDLHLDSPLRGLGALDDARATTLASAGRRAFDDLVQRAVDARVDAMLIAGDLWDGDWSDVSVGLHVAEKVGRLARAGIATFAVLGNHDAQSRVTDRIRHIEALHLFPADRPASVECGPAVIHGMSYAQPFVTDNIAALYPEAVPGRVNIGLLHTALDGTLGHDPYAPCTLADLRSRRYHYWALGHVHTRQVLADAAAVEGGTVAYCGVLQGRHVRESGVKGAWHGVVEGDRVRLTPVDFGHACWFEAQADVSAGDEGDAMRSAFQEVARQAGASVSLAVVRLRLVGETARHHALATRLRDLDDLARIAAAGVDERILVEDVRLCTAPPSEGERAVLPHRFDALLAEVAADPRTASSAETAVKEVLNALGPAARAFLAESIPELVHYEERGDLAPLLAEAARRVTARLREKIA